MRGAKSSDCMVSAGALPSYSLWLPLMSGVWSEVVQCQVESQNRKQGGKKYLTNQAILPHPLRGVYVGSDWLGCPRQLIFKQLYTVIYQI